MPTYSAYLHHQGRTHAVEIDNDFQQYHMTIGKFRFEAADLDGFELLNRDDFSPQELLAFGFNPEAVANPHATLELSQFQLSVTIPQLLINTENQTVIRVDLQLDLQLTSTEQLATVSLSIDDSHYQASSDFAEIIFDQLQQQFQGKYRLKNCYGCLYGDYSIYGQGFMSSMLCFKQHKQAYLAVADKCEYGELLPLHAGQHQEIDCCDEFESRTISVGYRGTVL